VSDVTKILDQLITEREAALSRVKLLNEVIDVIQNESFTIEDLHFLRSFLENSNKGRIKKILTIGSKMNVHADLLKKYNGYSDTKNVKDKVAIILETEGRFLPIKDIAAILLQLDFDKSKHADDYIKNLSPVLSTMAKNKDRITKVTADGNKKSTIWGLLEWMENGQPKNDFLI
jgi:hypothetical protein